MDWPWRIGDRLRLLERVGKRKERSIQGKVVALTDRFLVIDTGKYRVTLHRAEWQTGETKAQKVG